jgi:hypothetical protein
MHYRQEIGCEPVGFVTDGALEADELVGVGGRPPGACRSVVGTYASKSAGAQRMGSPAHAGMHPTCLAEMLLVNCEP